jgi:NOL1/NOP2/sun family putative RNA methylase
MQTPIPQAFLQRMRDLLGPELADFHDALHQPTPTGLRVNPLKINAPEFQQLSGWPLSPIPWCAEGFYADATDISLGAHPHHWAGLYYLQEPSAMAAVEALAPQPGERILDLCAAPGGKSTQIAAKLQGRGILVANDVVPPRARTLVENLQRFGAKNILVLAEEPQRLAERLPGYFDRVLADAPCSEEGMFRRSEAARRAWSPGAVAGCARRQSQILDSAAQMVDAGGTLAYSTCTFSPEENEDVVARFLLSHPDFELVEPGILLQDRGRSDWCSVEGGRALHLERTLRLWPHKARGDGHFIAVMRKTEGPAKPSARKTWPEDKGAFKAFRNFCEEALTNCPSDRVVKTHSHVYVPDSDAPLFSDLRVVAPGWWMGEQRGERFIPSHALALGLTLAQARQSLKLTAGDPLTARYTHGEALPIPGAEGWVMVGVDGFPLGWGHRVGSTLKNFYPKKQRFMSM